MVNLQRLTITSDESNITLADIKAHCHVYHDLDNDKINDIRKSAIDYVEGQCDTIIDESTFIMYISQFQPIIMLPKNPVNEIISFTYWDENEEEQTVTEFYTDLVASRPYIKMYDTFSYPALSKRPNPIEITFSAGYEVEPYTLLPYTIKQAVCVVAYEWWLNRSVGSLSDTTERNVRYLIGRDLTFNNYYWELS